MVSTIWVLVEVSLLSVRAMVSSSCGHGVVDGVDEPGEPETARLVLLEPGVHHGHRLPVLSGVVVTRPRLGEPTRGRSSVDGVRFAFDGDGVEPFRDADADSDHWCGQCGAEQAEHGTTGDG